MAYYRIIAYSPEHDFSAILDSHGKFEKLWEFSAFLISKGLTILEVAKHENMIRVNLDDIETPSDKIMLRSIAKGRPLEQELEYKSRRCKAICVGTKSFGLFLE